MLKRLALAVLLLAAALPAPAAEISHVHGIAVDPMNPARLLVATHHGLFALGPEGGAMRVSRDQHDLMGFAPHPTDKTLLFASGHPVRGGNLGVVVSRDGGTTWQQIAAGQGGPVDFHQMDISKAAPNVMYGAYNGALQASHDGGKSWRIVGPVPEGLIDIAAGAKSADRLYAATKTGLLTSADGGRSWTPAYLVRRPVSMVDVAADGTVHAYVVGTGLVRAAEATTQWTTLGGLAGDAVLLHFAVAPDRLVGVTQTSEILESRDDGKTWRSLLKARS